MRFLLLTNLMSADHYKKIRVGLKLKLTDSLRLLSGLGKSTSRTKSVDSRGSWMDCGTYHNTL